MAESKTTYDEAKVLEQALKGDEQAWQALYLRYRQRLYATAVHFLGYQDPEAEDVTQEAFAAAYSKLGSFESRSSFYTWINHICVFLCFQRLRQRRKAVMVESEDIEMLAQGQAHQQMQDQAQDGVRDQRLEIIRREMQQMGQGCRQILTLRDVEGVSYTVIAEQLKVPLGTVMSRLARCRQNLRERVLTSLGEGKP
jgi:RNA polymerase sigma-70 factor (ECF subfamily)